MPTLIMEKYSTLSQFSRSNGPIALAIGNFDGIHLGHQKLMKEITIDPELKAAVITFDPHPIKILSPNTPFKKLFPVQDQVEQFEKLKIDYLIKLSFDNNLASMNYKDFLDWLLANIDIKKIVVGYDFRFGKNKEGTFDNLFNWCREKNIEFVKIDEVKIQTVTVSTTEIKKRLENYDIDIITKMLGRNYYLQGVVVKGDQRGRLLGFPTANMEIENDLQVPALGVYATKVIVNGSAYFGVTNIGKTPTFKTDERIKIETHILDFDMDIYGKVIVVEFCKFIRKEKKFSSVDEIKIQIIKDIEESKK
jgi:riboflavin kinase/FMN adenylyltransferase